MNNRCGWITGAVIGLAAVIASCVVAGAYKYKYKSQETVVVTGLGEQEFTSDQIVWRGWIYAQNTSAEAGYRELEQSREKVQEYIRAAGIPEESVVFMFTNMHKSYESIYSGGDYMGQRFTGYELNQSFTIESKDHIEQVEEVSREISSLIAQGVQIESYQPEYYYSKLDEMKLQLIEIATADARLRAEKIASEAGARLKNLKNARMGVFQITGANTNEEFSAGGSFNTSSKDKKARITMRLEYTVR